MLNYYFSWLTRPQQAPFCTGRQLAPIIPSLHFPIPSNFFICIQRGAVDLLMVRGDEVSVHC